MLDKTIINSSYGGEMKNIKLILAIFLCVVALFALCSCAVQGKQGPKGDTGEKGADGAVGAAGKSAYELACANGYTGTLSEWLSDLSGEDGSSAYDIAVKNGYEGDEASWLAALKGEQGENGQNGRTAEFRVNENWVQWKYTDEADTAWRNLYEFILTVTDPSDPIPDGVPSAYLSTSSDSDNYGLAGSYTRLSNKEVAVGDKVTLTATVNAGYNFEGWYLDTWNSDSCLSKDLEYEYTMTDYDVTIEARYSCYTISVESDTDDYGLAGTYTMLTNKKTSVGSEVELVATVNEGYNFDGWFIDNVCMSNGLTYTYTMGENNVEIEAKFSSFTVNTTTYCNVAGVAGTYTNLYNKKVAVGSEIELTATVNDGYNFEGWYIDDVCVSRSLNYTYTMDRGNVEICAVYSCYKLTTLGYAVNANGDVDANFTAGTYTQYASENISAGKTITLVATVNDGYNFVGWYVGENCVSTALEYTFTMEKSDVEIYAVYNYYTLTTTARHRPGANWSHTDLTESAGLYIDPVYRDYKVSIGDTITVKANEIEGWVFICWRTEESILSYDMEYTFDMSAGNIYMYAEYYNE